MDRFDGLLARVSEQAGQLGIPLSKKIEPHVAVNRRAVRRFGACKYSGGRYTIELSARLQGAHDQACMQVLAHELLHTCPGCADHGTRWRGYAQRMNRAYGYDIRRTMGERELGLPEPPAKYIVKCTRCGARIERLRRSKLVAQPHRFRCRCGGELIVLQAERQRGGAD